MKKVAFIDGDGTIWNEQRRMMIAAEVAIAVTGMRSIPSKRLKDYPRLVEVGSTTIRRVECERDKDKECWERADVQGDYGPLLAEAEYCYEDVVRWNRVFYRVAFFPDLIGVDFPLPQAPEHLRTLVNLGYEVWILTSNPDATHNARLAWMARYHLDLLACSIGEGGRLVPNLITKPVAEHYTHTATWKAETIIKMAREQGIEKIATVDDRAENLDVLHEHPFWQSEEGRKIHVYGATSLQLAAGHLAFEENM